MASVGRTSRGHHMIRQVGHFLGPLPAAGLGLSQGLLGTLHGAGAVSLQGKEEEERERKPRFCVCSKVTQFSTVSLRAGSEPRQHQEPGTVTWVSLTSSPLEAPSLGSRAGEDSSGQCLSLILQQSKHFQLLRNTFFSFLSYIFFYRAGILLL